MAGRALSRSERIERGAARYQAKHPGATRAEARTAAVKAADQYDKRIASHLAKYPNASAAEAKRAARGHGSTGEHGVTVRPLGNNQYAVSFRDASKAGTAARAVERIENKLAGVDGVRVTVVVIDRDGNAREVFGNTGHSKGLSVKYLNTYIKDHGGSITKAVHAALASGTNHKASDAEDDEADEVDIVEYQIIVQ